MKTRAWGLIFALLLAVFVGCSENKTGKQTGINYPVKQDDKTGVKPNEVKAGSAGSDISKRQAKSQIGKKVYLTFDDGPDSMNTPVILDILDNYGIKATFFVIGTNVEKNPGVLKEIVKRGHAVGNHTYNHKYSDIYAGNNGFLSSLRINEELIYRTVGRRPYIVRDPGGKVRNNSAIKKILAQNKYWLIEWNVDSYDSRKPYLTAPQIIENVRAQAANRKLRPGMVILMHDGKGHMNTARALPTIIEMLKNEGFQFETLK